MRPDEEWYRAWVDAWRHGVRTTPHAVGLIEIASKRFLELSPAAARMFATTGADGAGLDYLALAQERSAAVRVFEAVESGSVDALQGRRRFQLDGRTGVDVLSVARAIRSGPAPDLGIWVVNEVIPDAGEPAPDVPRFEANNRSATRLSPVAFAELDRHWRVSRLKGDVDELLDLPASRLVGRQIVEMVHPRDVAPLLWALATVTSVPASALTIRLRADRSAWSPVDALLTQVDGEGELRFGLSLAPLSRDDGDWSRRFNELEQSMRRIALHLDEGTGSGRSSEALALSQILAAAELSPRQVEIVTRLLRGERVPAIATALYLAQSTVRNHLATVFRKFGVTSQQELITRLRDAS